MPIKFATDEWIKALMGELNKSENYRDAAKSWEGDFYFVITDIPGAPGLCTSTPICGMANAAMLTLSPILPPRSRSSCWKPVSPRGGKCWISSSIPSRA